MQFGYEATTLKVALRPGDIISVRRRGFLSWLIRRCERSKGEEPSWASHSAMIVSVEPTVLLAESLAKTVIRPLVAAYSGSRAMLVAHRLPELAEGQIAQVVSCAEEYVGRDYGWMKVAAHALDALLGGVYLFRRLCRLQAYPICSWVVAFAYEKGAGLKFGADADVATPDDIMDWCQVEARLVWADSAGTLDSAKRCYGGQ